MGDGQGPEDSKSDLIELDSSQTKEPEIQAEHTADAGVGDSIDVEQE
jgi:hypothetical protein